MQITFVTYRELKSVEGYNHKAIEATATVHPGESAQDVLHTLRAWVHAELLGGTQPAYAPTETEAV